MTCLSKSKLEDLLMEHPCKALLHPWNDSCILGSLQMCLSTCLGSIKLFAILYTGTLLFKTKCRKQIDFRKELRCFMKSVVFGMLYGTTVTALNCLFRKVLGYYSYYVLGFVVPIASGMAIFLKSPERIAITNSTFLPMAIDGFYQSVLVKNNIKLTRFSETIIFMLLNGILMCNLRKQQVLKNLHNPIWFFFPPKLSNSEPEEDFIREVTKKVHCTHELTCKDSLKKELIKFGIISMLLSSVKIIARNIKTPLKIFGKFLQLKTYKLTAFALVYVGLFKVISCYLYNSKGESLENTFVAGTIAGLSYTFNPSRTFFFSSLAALLQIAAIKIRSKYRIPNLPYAELCFILTNWYMFYIRLFDKSSCPKYVYDMFNFATENKSEVLNNFLETIVTKAKV